MYPVRLAYMDVVKSDQSQLSGNTLLTVTSAAFGTAADCLLLFWLLLFPSRLPRLPRLPLPLKLPLPLPLAAFPIPFAKAKLRFKLRLPFLNLLTGTKVRSHTSFKTV